LDTLKLFATAVLERLRLSTFSMGS